MVVRAATALIAYQSPRLTAIAIAFLLLPLWSSASDDQHRHLQYKGELVDHSEQRNVRRDDLPLLLGHDADVARQEG
jgi:hypothetical protein